MSTIGGGQERTMTLSGGFKRIMVTLALAVSAAAQTPDVKLPDIKLPDTAPGKTLSEWLAMCKSPNLEQMTRSEEHTSELQSQFHLVCRLLLEKKKQNK